MSMIDHFNNSMALCNLGNAYFALGSSLETYLVVQMLVAMVASNLAFPFAFTPPHSASEIGPCSLFEPLKGEYTRQRNDCRRSSEDWPDLSTMMVVYKICSKYVACVFQ